MSQGDPGWDNSDPTCSPTRDPKTRVEDDTLPGSDAAYPGPTSDGFKDFPARTARRDYRVQETLGLKEPFKREKGVLDCATWPR